MVVAAFSGYAGRPPKCGRRGTLGTPEGCAEGGCRTLLAGVAFLALQSGAPRVVATFYGCASRPPQCDRRGTLGTPEGCAEIGCCTLLAMQVGLQSVAGVAIPAFQRVG